MGSGSTDGDGRYVLQGRAEEKLLKIKAMVCTPGFLRGQIGEEAYKQKATGGTMFCERNRTRVSFSECGALVAASSLRHHIERSYG